MNISYIPKESIHRVPRTNKLCGPVVNSPNTIQRDVNQGKWTEEVSDMAVTPRRSPPQRHPSPKGGLQDSPNGQRPTLGKEFMG